MQFTMSNMVRAAGRVMAAGFVAATALAGVQLSDNHATPAEAASNYTLTLARPAAGTGALGWKIYTWEGFTGASTGVCGDTSAGVRNECSVTVPIGAVLDVYPQPLASYNMIGWSGMCNTGVPSRVYGYPTRCNFTMTADFTASAAPFVKSRTLSLTPTSVGATVAWQNSKGTSGVCGYSSTTYGALVGCTPTALSGTTFTLTAQPGYGMTVGYWTGPCSGAQGTVCSFQVSEDASVMVTFTAIMKRITVSPAPAGGVLTMVDIYGNRVIECGSTSGTLCSSLVPQGDQIVSTAVTTADGYRFIDFGGACSGQECKPRIDGDTTVSANFVSASMRRVNISVSRGRIQWSASNGASGSCTGQCTVWVASGTNMSFNRNYTDPAYFVGSWTSGCGGAGESCGLTITTDTTVAAAYRSMWG